MYVAKTKFDLYQNFRISLHGYKDKAIMENCKKILMDGKKMAFSCPGVTFATPCHHMATGLNSVSSIFFRKLFTKFNMPNKFCRESTEYSPEGAAAPRTSQKCFWKNSASWYRKPDYFTTSFKNHASCRAVLLDYFLQGPPISPIHKLLDNFSATLGFFGNFQLVEHLSMHRATSKFLCLYSHSHANATSETIKKCRI